MSKKTTEAPKTLVLIDAHAIIHRAYHALPDFASSTGEPTGALYGLSAMLIRIVADLKPDYIAACFDLPELTHRHEVFEGYKGTRTKTDDALVAQLIRARSVFEAFGIPMYEAPGFEADDCLGTIVHHFKKEHPELPINIIIASGDMDTLQLVQDKKVQVYTQRKGPNDIVLYDEDAVNARYGFGPEHIPDYKGLRGDPSDNIPGIKGIGEKTATSLITTFGTIEDLYKAVKKKPEALLKANIKGKTAELVLAGEDEAVFSKMLATIRMDAPIHYSLPTHTWREVVDQKKIFTLFDELGFRSLEGRVKKMLGGAVVDEAAQPAPEPAAPPVSALAVDQLQLKETAVATWLLHSDTTNPSLEDILRFAKTDSFENARAHIFDLLKKTGRLQSVYDTIERPLIAVLEKMKIVGIALDTKYLSELSGEYHKALDGLSAKIFGYVGHEFNINSPKQLGDVLFDELNLAGPKQKKTAGGQRSTKEDELQKLVDAHPIVGEILSYRELQKLLSTYVDSLPTFVGPDGRLHTEFIQSGAATGRMAGQNPNLQNIPIKTEYGRRVRNAFVAADGFTLVALDYSQVELRIAAALSGDKKLISVFTEGGDVHTAVASEVFKVPRDQVTSEMRRRAKVINFGIIYGMGVNALRTNLGAGVSREDASKFLADYFSNFSELASYLEHTKAEAAKNGFTETLFGRRRYFAGFKSTLPYVRAQAERMAVNAPIQGTQADIIKKAMVESDRVVAEKKWDGAVRLLLQVHDELVYEVKTDMVSEVIPVVQHIMESVLEPRALSGIPLKVDAKTGPNWGDMKKIG